MVLINSPENDRETSCRQDQGCWSVGHGALCEGGVILAIVALAFLVYGNVLQAPFLFDDSVNITDNPSIRLTSLTLKSLGRAAFESPTAHRPVAFLSFALNYYLHGYNVFGYHLVNILIHAATAILLFYLLRATLLLDSMKDLHGRHAATISFLAATLWLVHPLQTQTVTYVVQRMTGMSAMFYVMSMLFYVRARLADGRKKKTFLLMACLTSGLLALGSKEIAVTLPFFILLYEWYFLQDLDGAWLKRRSPAIGVISAVLVLVCLLYLGGHPVERILGGYGWRDFTLPQRVMTEFRVVLYYMSLLFFPHPSRLSLFHDFPLSTSLLEPSTTLYSLAGIVTIFTLAWRVARRERLLSFAIFWFLGNLVLESSVISLEIIFEHRNYLPSMFVVAAFVSLLFRFASWRRLHLAILPLLVLLCTLWSLERNSIWRDELAFWQDSVAKAPSEARAYSSLGVVIARSGNPQDAIPYYLKAVQLKPSFSEAYNNLGISLAMSGRLEEAVENFRKALVSWPDSKSAHYNLGMALERLGRIEESISHYREVIKIRPDEVKALFLLANALFRLERYGEARQFYARVLELQPDHSAARHNMDILVRQTLIAP